MALFGANNWETFGTVNNTRTTLANVCLAYLEARSSGAQEAHEAESWL